MWHQYGRLPQGEEGVFLEISKPKFRPVIVESPPGDATGPSFTNPVGSAPRSDLSLANLIGFSATSQRLGQVAETKTIREAVVAVPFIEKDNERKFFEIPLSLINLQSDALTRETLATSQVESIQQMIADGATSFVEVGPGKVLRGLLRKIDRSVEGKSATLNQE